MSSSSLDASLLNQIPGFRVICLEECPSTNLTAEKLLDEGSPDGPLLIVANSQTAGLGRWDRVWHNRPGEDIAATFVIPLDRMRLPRLILPLATGLSASLALESLGLKDVRLKWPNDVMFGGVKAGGILCKTVGGKWFIAGIGLNHAPSKGRFPAELAPHVAAIEDYPEAPSREATISALAQILLDRLCSTKCSAAATLEGWSARSHTLGERIAVKTDSGMLTGADEGLGPNGELMLRLDSGETRSLLDCIQLRVVEK